MVSNVQGFELQGLMTYYVGFKIGIAVLVIVFLIATRQLRKQYKIAWTTAFVLCIFFLVQFLVDCYLWEIDFPSEEYTLPEIILDNVIAVVFFAFTIVVFIQIYKAGKDFYAKQQQIAQDKITLALSQIKPHFIYNVLNSIYFLCDEDPKKAQSMVLTFSDYLRSNLDSIENKELISFEDEMKHVKAYCNLELIRFENKLKVEYDINVMNFNVPPLSLQPLVENAIKHGVCKKDNGGTVKISTYSDTNNYIIEISDDGVGFNTKNQNQDTSKSHVGMKNITKRLKYSCKAHLDVKSEPGVGTTVKVFIPKKHQTQHIRKHKFH